AVEVRTHGSDNDRRKPPAIPPTKHRDGLHAHLNGFGASRAVRFAYAPPGLGLSHRDVRQVRERSQTVGRRLAEPTIRQARPAWHRWNAYRWARRGASGRQARGASDRTAGRVIGGRPRAWSKPAREAAAIAIRPAHSAGGPRPRP